MSRADELDIFPCPETEYSPWYCVVPVAIVCKCGELSGALRCRGMKRTAVSRGQGVEIRSVFKPPPARYKHHLPSQYRHAQYTA